MEILEIYDDCAEILALHGKRGTTAELFKPLYPYPLDDAGSIAEAIGECDRHTSKPLEEKLNRAMMDLAEIPETVGEALMFRLRAENAVNMLAILSQSPIRCEVRTSIREEGIFWALTALWKAGRGQWANRTAMAFCRGMPSALAPIPGH